MTRTAAIVASYPAPAFDPAATLAAVEEERCTSLYGVPAMFIAELAQPGFDAYDLSSLRTGAMGGAPCQDFPMTASGKVRKDGRAGRREGRPSSGQVAD
jgi:acyl-CoA synthetase (AMP-forming)/AMP-acid ligase II